MHSSYSYKLFVLNEVELKRFMDFLFKLISLEIYTCTILCWISLRRRALLLHALHSKLDLKGFNTLGLRKLYQNCQKQNRVLRSF